MNTYFHGECVIKQVTQVPKKVTKITPNEGRYIVASSETTGNHHCILAGKGIELFEKEGTLFLKNNVPATVFCVDATRHDTEVIPVGTWEIGRANEYDYLTEMKRKVQD